MEKIEMLERLISIKNNAAERGRNESQGNPLRQHEIEAYILQHGIEQLIIEIQNTFLADHQTTRSSLTYKISVSSQAS